MTSFFIRWGILAVPELAPIFEAIDGFLLQPTADARRLFHGRGGCYDGLQWCTVDAFAPALLVTLFSPPPARALMDIRAYIARVLPSGMFNRLAVQHRYLPGAPYQWVQGDSMAESFAQRGENRFHLRYNRQNLGFFLDMEPGRRWLEERAIGASVLNLFSYTCAFSVVAQAAGARKVVNVDMSKAALTMGRENHRINGLATDRIKFMPLDVLKSWSRIRRDGPYDIVIIDPPTFQKGSFIAERDYSKVIRRLPELMSTKGDVLACLNAPELGEQFILDLFAEHAVHCSFVQRLPCLPEFCDIDPQRQLKLMHFQGGL